MDELTKLAADAFVGELDILFKLAEADGVEDEDFSIEKRAAFHALSESIDEEAFEELEKIAMEELGIDKEAVWGGLARMFGGAAKALAGAGAKVRRLGRGAAARAAKPPKAFARVLAKRGRTPAGAQREWLRYRKVGPVGLLRRRRVRAAASARSQPSMKRVKPLAAGAPKATAKARKAPTKAQAAKAMNGMWPSVKSGLLWGGGFGAGQRIMAPAEQPQVILGNY